jgi:hypothetical protein
MTISLAGGAGGATLGGTLKVTAVKGVATFTGLTLTTAGTGYIIQAASGTLTSVRIGAISVTPAAAAKLILTTVPPATAWVGDPFGVTVDVEDPYGNLVTSFKGSVTVALASNPGGSTLGGTLTATAAGGVATFSGLTLNKPGTGYTLKVTSGSLTAATTAAFNATYPGYLPNQIATAYGINKITFGKAAGTGSGQTIAIVDPYNDPNIAADLAQFDQMFNLPAASLSVVNQHGQPAGRAVPLARDRPDR